MVHVPPPPTAKPADGAALPEPLRGILAEIDLPAPYGAKSEPLPEFSAKALEDYAANDKATPFRAAVSKARAALAEQVKGLRMPRGVSRSGRARTISRTRCCASRRTWPGPSATLTDVLDDLKKAGDMPRGRAAKRWRADYDYVLARLELELAWLNEYEFALGELRRDERPPLDPKEHTGWRLAPAEVSRADVSVRKMGSEAVKRLQQVAQDYPGTPWEWFAKRDAGAPIGLAWKAAKVEE